jgi:hypothetical protein
MKKAMQKANKNIPLETVVISTRGKILKQEKDSSRIS